jgi:hypothetical protein
VERAPGPACLACERADIVSVVPLARFGPALTCVCVQVRPAHPPVGQDSVVGDSERGVYSWLCGSQCDTKRVGRVIGGLRPRGRHAAR